MKINPVLKNELKLGSRTVKNALLIFGYNLVLFMISMLFLYSMLNTARYGYEVEYATTIQIYRIMTYMEFAMVVLILPALAASKIAGERERQTLDVLLITKMDTMHILLGKLQSSLGVVLTLAVSSLPILSIVFIYGGIGALELLGFIVILVVSAIFIGSIGIFYSVYYKKVTSAIIASYITIAFLLAGTTMIWLSIGNFQEYVETNPNQLLVMIIVCLLLFNPAISFYGLINSQISAGYSLVQVLGKYINYPMEYIVDNWIGISMCCQLIMAFILLRIASKKLDPWN